MGQFSLNSSALSEKVKELALAGVTRKGCIGKNVGGGGALQLVFCFLVYFVN